MTSLFLAPHNDDEVLFGCWSLLRYQPLVVIVLRSDVQERRHGFGVTAAEREAETGAAMDVLGCDWEQWPYLDSNPPWDAIRNSLAADARADDWERVFAPAVEEGGHEHHNRIGEIAADVFGDRVTSYLTYTNGRERSTGVSVPYENQWVALKLCALAQYQSQIRLESTCHHFTGALHEYYQA